MEGGGAGRREETKGVGAPMPGVPPAPTPGTHLTPTRNARGMSVRLVPASVMMQLDIGKGEGWEGVGGDC
jgi:hypothetical protein